MFFPNMIGKKETNNYNDNDNEKKSILLGQNQMTTYGNIKKKPRKKLALNQLIHREDEINFLKLCFLVRKDIH